MKRLSTLCAVLLLLLAGCAQADAGLPPAAGNVTDLSPGPAVALDDTAEPGHAQLTQRQTGDVIEIKEKMFIAQTNDIYLNAEDYFGKTIRYEGIYMTEEWRMEDHVEEIHYVIRYGPGCCGTDGNAGFEIVWDGDYPEQDDWVEVVGVLGKLEVGELYILQLHLTDLNILDERGAEFVVQ